MSHEHLSDEQLSALLDGRASDEPSSTGPGHASFSSCARCRERLAALEGARDLVRTPVTAPSASARAAAVRAALSDVSSPDVTRGETASVTSAASVRGPVHRSRLPLGAAAAVVALALAAGIPIALSHRGSTQTSSAAHETGRRPTTTPAPSAPVPSAAGATTTVPDLGSIGSVRALRSNLAHVLPPRGSAAVYGNSSNLSTQSDSARSGISLPATSGIPAPFASCVDSARQKAGPELPLAFVATATYDGTPALVVVLEVPPSTSGSSPATGSSSGTGSRPATQHLALVVARSGCGVLARTTF